MVDREQGPFPWRFFSTINTPEFKIKQRKGGKKENKKKSWIIKYGANLQLPRSGYGLDIIYSREKDWVWHKSWYSSIQT